MVGDQKLVVDGGIFKRNHAGTEGGAMVSGYRSAMGGEIIFRNGTLFEGNTASKGGAIAVHGLKLGLYDTSISDNVATDQVLYICHICETVRYYCSLLSHKFECCVILESCPGRGVMVGEQPGPWRVS
jgi:predicted outer membrane repeat protein